LELLDQWIKDSDTAVSRPEALRRMLQMVALGLKR
jgi:hypothetical protein